MLFVRYALVIAACIQQRCLAGASRSRNDAKEGEALLKGESTARPAPFYFRSKFSFQKFATYAKTIYANSLLFHRQRDVLKFLKEGRLVTEITPEMKTTIKDWIKEKGEFPNFYLNLAGKVASTVEGKLPNSQKQSKKVELLNKVLGGQALNKVDKHFAGEWLAEGVEVKSAIQRNFLNGIPDDDTITLFDSLNVDNFDAVKGFFPKHHYHLERICQEISNNFFEAPVKLKSFSPIEHYETKYPTLGKYHRKSRYLQKDKEKLANEIGFCRDERNAEIIYFKVAIAKVEEPTDAKGSFRVRYFIAFDQYEKYKLADEFDSASYVAVPQVAISFSGIYKTKDGNTFDFQPNFSSLREMEKGKGKVESSK